MGVEYPSAQVAGYTVLAGDWNVLARNWQALIESASIDLDFGEIIDPTTGTLATLAQVESSTGDTEKPNYEVYLFDDSTVEVLVWEETIPRLYGFNPFLEIPYYMIGANVSKTAKFRVLISAKGDGDIDIDAREFDSENALIFTVPDAAKALDVQLIDLSNMDNAEAGDNIVIWVERDGDDAVNDTAIGDLALLKPRIIWDYTS